MPLPRHLTLRLTPFALLIFTASCTPAAPAAGNAAASYPAAGQTSAVLASTPATAPARGGLDSQLRNAAEPFEKLTETAFTASMAKIDATIHDANVAAQGVRGDLAPDAASRLNAQLAAVREARNAQDRASLAIASIEAYRVLVSAISPASKVPVEVSLLDYAGFRYDADLKATPARWADASQAATYARHTWDSIAPRITDTALKAKFDKAVGELNKFAASRNSSAAQSAVATELDLVDQLEKYFTSKNG